MRLRPRYSLLTLFVLTALVAGGVKLWHGPHHVVERIEELNPIVEDEYSYTLDWRGNRVIHGPRIGRLYIDEDKKTLWLVEVNYYRNGTKLKCRYACCELLSEHRGIRPLPQTPFPNSVLSVAEEAELLEAIRRERPQKIAADCELSETFSETGHGNVLLP